MRDKVAEMRRMAEEYAKPDYVPSPKQTKEAAREAEALAKLHRDLDKTIP